ncbi:hypothetical protein L0B53_04465 [Vibrio sp. SS-MA-C1-2]|uniref:DUF2541 family protein n=1 Tax=Vibrio sp. SS-MA-C1-2 TaxID=2908646 RepID=UPI001F34DC77|nr:hypothetical protein [Vibrio sp. SS-MA-C1-2]UJF17174.1 hypothetical protein L0B53_04465 [Vibrio sp. SS-MA-C1-2]
MKKIISLVFAFSVLLVSTTSYAATWQQLGTKSVRMNGDMDIIPVTVYKGGFTKLKLTVRKSAVHINKVVVEYSNGAHDSLPIRALIAPKGESRVMDLRGGKRAIKKVTLYYRSAKDGRGTSVVTVWGRK